MHEERIELLTSRQEKCVLAAMYVPAPAILVSMLLIGIGVAGPVGPEPWLMVFALIGVFVFFVNWLVRSLGLHRPNRKRVRSVGVICGIVLILKFLWLARWDFFAVGFLMLPSIIFMAMVLPFALFLAPRHASRYR